MNKINHLATYSKIGDKYFFYDDQQEVYIPVKLPEMVVNCGHRIITLVAVVHDANHIPEDNPEMTFHEILCEELWAIAAGWFFKKTDGAFLMSYGDFCHEEISAQQQQQQEPLGEVRDPELLMDEIVRQGLLKILKGNYFLSREVGCQLRLMESDNENLLAQSYFLLFCAC